MTTTPPATTRKLNDEHKTYVVKRLAAFDKPAAIAHALLEAFGVSISPQAIEHYDPERPPGHDLAPRWREAFYEARKAHLARAADLGHLDTLVRLHLRGRMAIAAFEEGDYRLANDILDRIAKEAGDVFTGRHGQGPFGAGAIQPTAVVTITGPAEPEPAPETVDGVREPRD